MRGLIDSKTRHEILSIISNHVAALNYIFGETKFDGRLSHRGIKFQIQRTKVGSESRVIIIKYLILLEISLCLLSEVVR